MSAHAERRIDEDGTLALERGSKQLEAALEHDRGVDVAQVHDRQGLRGRVPWVLIPIRSDLAPGKWRQGGSGWESGLRRQEPQNRPGITSCSSSAYVSSLASA
ncbi:hypothetical protein GCM10025760_31260 [Microbacterium yannicii]|uniref:Uncharacterized protein n=1 Tax=Microbacterium yannicii TaxID=671622 RepID=A0ABP9MKN2_9MICO